MALCHRYAQQSLSWHLSQLALGTHCNPGVPAQAQYALVHCLALNGEWLSHRVRAAAGSATSAQLDVRGVAGLALALT